MLGIQFSLKANIPGSVMGEYEEEYDMEQFENEIEGEIADKALSEWEHLAAATLGETAAGYIASMQAESDGKGKVTLTLDNSTSEGALANMQEHGAKPFDMKPGLLGTKDYTVIGLSHGNPAKGELNPLPKRVYDKAKMMHMGQRFSDTTRRKSSAVTGYKHKSSLYADMSKVSARKAKKFGGSFVTFRAISNNSSPQSWWHPGFVPLNLIEKVKESIERDFSDILNKARRKRIPDAD